MTGGHRAFRSTLEQVQRRGFWLGWRRDVDRFCRQCPPARVIIVDAFLAPAHYSQW